MNHERASTAATYKLLIHAKFFFNIVNCQINRVAHQLEGLICTIDSMACKLDDCPHIFSDFLNFRDPDFLSLPVLRF